MTALKPTKALRLSVLGLRLSGIASKFLLGLFIAKFMSLTDLGIYGLLQGLVAVAPVVIRAGWNRQLARELTAASSARQSQLLSSYFGLYLIVYAVVAAVAATLGAAALLPMFAVVIVLLVAGEHLALDSYDFLVQLQRPLAANVVLALLSASWPVLFMIAAYAQPEWRTLSALSGFWLGGSLAALTLAAGLLRRHVTTFQLPSLGDVARSVRASLMLYANSLTSTATIYLDRYLVGLFLSLELAGVYFFFWQVGNAIYNLVNSGVMSFARPHLVTAYQSGDEAGFRKLDASTTRSALIETLVLALAAAAALWVVVPYLGRPLLVQYQPLLWALLAAVLVRIYAETSALMLYCRNQDQRLMFSTALSAALTAVLLPLGVLAEGVYGVAIALLVMYGLVAAYRRYQPAEPRTA